MFRKRKKEQQSLIDASRRSLEESEGKCVRLNNELKTAIHNNEVLLQRNRKDKALIADIKKLTEINTYSNPELILRKIRELIADNQSNN